MDATTIDCANLSDSDIEKMADLCTQQGNGFDIGFLSKQREIKIKDSSRLWVLCTRAYEGDKLRGFAWCSLRRVGGVPSMLVGPAAFVQTAASEQALKAVMRELYHRAVLAFPDEDVLVGTRLKESAGYRAFRGLSEIVPFPEKKVSGEERAWGRRLAKEFQADGRLDDRTFVLKGDSEPIPFLDFSPKKAVVQPEEVQAQFKGVTQKRHDALVVFGWAMAEDLAGAKLPK
jgi:hypothetical protein